MKRRLLSEFLGTAGLVCAVVGSGIMAERLSGGNVAIALLANTAATGAALFFLIASFAPVSGAHFNPAVTLANLLSGNYRFKEGVGYFAAQFSGGLLGTAVANLMFGLPALFASTKVRTGGGQWLGEFVATFGLVGVIIAVTKKRQSVPVVAGCVAAFISAAYWFTSSTSFANPAVTLARAFSDTFAGIRLIDVPVFVVMQFIGAVAAYVVFNWLFAEKEI
jgi:glycerol uptake facilitator-like aquaporin